MSKKLAIVADAETALLFRLVGVVDVFSIDSGVEAIQIVERLAETKNYALVMLTQNLAEEIGREFEHMVAKFKDLSIVVIPSRKGPAVKKSDVLREIIRRAVGFEVLTK